MQKEKKKKIKERPESDVRSSSEDPSRGPSYPLLSSNVKGKTEVGGKNPFFLHLVQQGGSFPGGGCYPLSLDDPVVKETRKGKKKRSDPLPL